MRALFIVNQHEGAGNGHRVRCGALADELRARGWDTETVGSMNAETADYLRPEHADLDAAITDVQWNGPRFEVVVPTARCKVMIVDKPRDATGIDLLVNGGAGATPEQYAQSGAAKVLAGPEYALLRPAFRTLHLAGSPRLPCPPLDVRKMPESDEQQMALALYQAEIVITPGGMRAMEAACVGAPMILFIESDDQEQNALALQRKCAGMIARDEEYARKLTRDLLKDPDWLARMSAAGRRLVDGLGCKRVADEIERLVA